MTERNTEALIQKVLKISNTKSSIFLYKLVRMTIRTLGFWYFRVKINNAQNLRQKNRLIIAAVHRSNLDGPLINAHCQRRIRSLAKISMFKSPLTTRISSIIGAIPVDREKNDRKALALAEKILESEEALLLFPEGERGSGTKLQKLFGGCAFLSIRAQAPILPVSLAGTEAAMPPGKKFPKRTQVNIEVGEIMQPPKSNTKSSREKFTNQIQAELQRLMDLASI